MGDFSRYLELGFSRWPVDCADLPFVEAHGQRPLGLLVWRWNSTTSSTAFVARWTWGLWKAESRPSGSSWSGETRTQFLCSQQMDPRLRGDDDVGRVWDNPRVVPTGTKPRSTHASTLRHGMPNRGYRPTPNHWHNHPAASAASARQAGTRFLTVPSTQ